MEVSSDKILDNYIYEEKNIITETRCSHLILI